MRLMKINMVKNYNTMIDWKEQGKAHSDHKTVYIFIYINII